MNIRILLTADQGPHGLGSPVLGLHLNRDQGACRSDEEILFQRRIVPFIVIEFVSRLDHCFANHIFVKRALIDAEIFVGSQILLRFFVQHGHKQAAVGKVDFILGIVIVALKRQFREIQAVADIDHSRIVQPFHTASIVSEAGAGGNFGRIRPGSYTTSYRGVAQLVARLLWGKPPGQFHNLISGCCAVGSAPALGA